jgi:exonuclease SbcC
MGAGSSKGWSEQMKIKALALKNIRSYRDLEVSFPDGIILFEGDIGSGKSTLLYAIELGLFGPAEGGTRKKSDFYLRAGEKEGWVRLDIEAGGKEYSLHREINKTGSGACKLSVDGAFAEFSPTEMRKNVLDILGFNEPPGTRALSVIYRYAVFTPQEEMKKILVMEEDDRIQTLRKAFRIEDYKVARENAEIAASRFQSRSDILKEVEKELAERRQLLKESGEARERLAGELVRYEKEAEEARGSLGKLDEEVRKLEALRDRRDRHEGEARRLRDRLEHLNDWLAKADGELVGMNEEQRRRDELLPKVASDQESARRLKELEGISRERQVLALELAGLRRDLHNIDQNLKNADLQRGELDTLTVHIKQMESEVDDYRSVEDRVNNLQGHEAKLREKIENIISRIGELEQERHSYESLEKGKRCPKCGQELSSAHLKKLLDDGAAKMTGSVSERVALCDKLRSREVQLRAGKKLLKEIAEKRDVLRQLEGEAKALRNGLSEAKELAKKRDSLSDEAKKAEEQLAKKDIENEVRILREQQEEWRGHRDEFSRLEERLAGMRRRLEQVDKYRREKDEAQLSIENLEKELKGLASMYDECLLSAKKEQRERNLRRSHSLDTDIGWVKRSLEDAAGAMGRLAIDINEREQRISDLARYREGAAWLSEFFGPALAAIERHVMSHINVEFEELLKKWFGMLFEGTELEVAVDENFTPMVRQGGYELDIRALSGGEKTAVAFAYRLALNHMVKEVSGVDRSNLLILDEPTDGFSTEQMAKVRDVLRELNAPQLILVSHERELEGFADHIFKVVKENGVSRIETARG